MMKKILSLLSLVLLLGVFGTTLQAESVARYETYTISNQRLVRTQTAYMPITSVSEIFGVSLGTPHDIHIDQDNNIYIVSEGSDGGKLIVFNLENEEIEVIGEDFLIEPTGVHVNTRGEILIADYGARLAYRLDSDGEILHTFERPDSPLFGGGTYRPQKIIGDSRGNVFILSPGPQGLAQFSPTGQFLGYYGANTIQPTLRTILQHTFFTEEQQERIFNITPPEVTNVAIDQRGLIHTVSRGVEDYAIKRLNISGQNLLPAMYGSTDLRDIAVGPLGNIYAISTSGMIYEYDREGNLLFAFGGRDTTNQIKGLFDTPRAIAVDSDFNIFAIDRGAGEMQIFMPTEFATLVHTALDSYQDGFYLESQDPWSQVLKMNDFFDLGHQGMGNAYYSLGEYEEALEAYENAFDRNGYSDAYWEVRNAWLLDNVGALIMVLFIYLFMYVINLKLKFMHLFTDPIKKVYHKARAKSKTYDEVMYAFSYLRNPADATYEIKRKKRVGYFSASLLLLLYFGFYLYYIYNLNFLFNYRVISNINLGEEVIKVFLPILLWVLSNYLIGSIREGEGRLKDVYITTIYCLLPFFIMLPVITILSHALTHNEAFLITMLQTLSIMITVVYFFFMVKETHYYNVKETFQSIFISAFTMVMLLLGTFIIYILLNEFVSLFRDIVMEVMNRVQ